MICIYYILATVAASSVDSYNLTNITVFRDLLYAGDMLWPEISLQPWYVLTVFFISFFAYSLTLILVITAITIILNVCCVAARWMCVLYSLLRTIMRSYPTVSQVKVIA